MDLDSTYLAKENVLEKKPFTVLSLSTACESNDKKGLIFCLISSKFGTSFVNL